MFVLMVLVTSFAFAGAEVSRRAILGRRLEQSMLRAWDDRPDVSLRARRGR